MEMRSTVAQCWKKVGAACPPGCTAPVLCLSFHKVPHTPPRKKPALLRMIDILSVLGEKRCGFPARSQFLSFAFVFLFFWFFSSLNIIIKSLIISYNVFSSCPPKLLISTLCNPNSLSTLGVLTSSQPCHFVKFGLPNFSWEWGLSWSMVTLPGATSLKKADLPSPSSHQMLIISQLMVEFHATHPYAEISFGFTCTCWISSL